MYCICVYVKFIGCPPYLRVTGWLTILKNKNINKMLYRAKYCSPIKEEGGSRMRGSWDLVLIDQPPPL